MSLRVVKIVVGGSRRASGAPIDVFIGAIIGASIGVVIDDMSPQAVFMCIGSGAWPTRQCPAFR
jgi:hypothetical protein